MLKNKPFVVPLFISEKLKYNEKKKNNYTFILVSIILIFTLLFLCFIPYVDKSNNYV